MFYIDHGNTEKLPINQIRILSGEFYNTIAQAKPVSLSNVTLFNSGWSFKKIVLILCFYVGVPDKPR